MSVIDIQKERLKMNGIGNGQTGRGSIITPKNNENNKK